MGKFIETNEKTFVNNYVQSFITSTDEYSKFQEGSPTFCTYYSVDTRASTADPGLGEVVELIGDESPIRYNRIEDFPLYAMEELIPNLDFDEQMGLATEVEGTALLLPNTIVPNIDDLFLISYAHEQKLYRVNNIETSSYSSKTFYKISFNKENSGTSILDSKQVIDDWKVVYKNIGTEYKSVIPSKEYLVLDEVLEFYEKLSSDYIKYFYDKKLGCFIFNGDKVNSIVKDLYTDQNIYDPKLALFINKHELFIDSRTFLKNIHVESLLEDRYFDYDYTIYNLLDSNDINSFNYDKFYLTIIVRSLFIMFKEKYYEFVHYNEFPVDLAHPNQYNIFKSNFKELLNNYTTLDELNKLDIDNIEKLLIVFLKEFDNLKMDMIYDSYIKDITVNRDIHSYTLIPCVLFVLKSIKLKIFNKGR